MDRFIPNKNDVVVIPHWVDTSIKGVRNPYDKNFHKRNYEARHEALSELLGGSAAAQQQQAAFQQYDQRVTLGGQAAQQQGLSSMLGGIGGVFGK